VPTTLNAGSFVDDPTADNLYALFGQVNNNFSELSHRPINPCAYPYNASGSVAGDDTTAIQNALNDGAAASPMRPVLLEGGVFNVSSHLLIPAGSVFWGRGRQTEIRRKLGTVFAATRSSIMMNYSAQSWTTGLGTDTNIVVGNMKLNMFTEGGNTRPSSSRLYATASFYGVTGLYLFDMWFDQAMQFDLDMDTCDQAHVKKIRVDAQYPSTPVGNVDGVHFTNCRDFSLTDALLYGGDDMVGVTTDTNGRTSYRGSILQVRGSSRYANGVAFNSESLGGFDITAMTVDHIQFRSVNPTPTGVAVRFKGDAAAAGTFNIISGRSQVSNVIAETCASALELNFAQEVDAENIRGESTLEHAIYVNGSKDCSLSNLTTRRTGAGTSLDKMGVNIGGSTGIKVSGVDSISDGRWGVQVISSTDVRLDQINCKGGGTASSSATDKGGVRINASTNVTVGAGSGAKDDGTGNTKYGLLVDGVCADVRVYGDISTWSGVTKDILNNANTGCICYPGQIQAWVSFNPTAGVANYLASSGDNVTGITWNADGDYSILLALAFSTNFACVPFGSASNGNTANDLVVKIKAITADAASPQIRIAITNGAGALVLPTNVYFGVTGRIGTVP
jgi:hypothetical protein